MQRDSFYERRRTEVPVLSPLEQALWCGRYPRTPGKALHDGPRYFERHTNT